MAAGRAQALQDRTNEIAALERLLEAVRNDQSAVVVLRGEAGVGKTALAHDCARRASGFRVVEIAGIQSEIELAFAGLQQLCSPLLGRLGRLPGPQQEALRVALGLSTGEPPDRFLVALATLNLLSEAAADEPLFCIVDDAQWLDSATGQVLGFVARRLLAEPLALVFAVREPSNGRQLVGLPELRLTGLSEKDAGALLATVVSGRLDDAVRDRIVAETGGNPLALLELPRGMSAAELAGGFPLAVAGDLPAQIEEHYLRRLDLLAKPTQRLILLAAADPTGDATLLWRAARTLGIGRDAADPAEIGQLLEIGAHVRFRHPLVRSALYRAASLEERRTLHRALAAATDAEVDPDRRVWHLAMAAPGPDEDVAGELERSASRAQARGGLAAAAAFLERSAALTPDAARRVDRALAAAEAHLRAGAFEAALAALAIAEAGGLENLQRARADVVRSHVVFASGLGGNAPELLLKAASGLEPYDLQLARETYLIAWAAAVFAARRDAGVQICRAILDLPPPSDDPRPIDVLLDGLALLTTEGPAAASPTLQRAAKALADMPDEDVLRWGWAGPGAAWAVWDHEGAYAAAERHVQIVRDAGALAELPNELISFAQARAWTGDLAGVAALVAETETVAQAIGSPMAPYLAMRLAALRGREAEVSALMARGIEQAAAEGQGSAATQARWAAAVLYNGLGRYEEAASSARRATTEAFDPWVSVWALPELVEAAARAGHAELAREALERLADTTRPSGTDWALGIEARCRALLSEGDTAERSYHDAIDRLARTRLRPELARAHLLYGEWLRRQHRQRDARQQLRAAYDVFTSIGMEAFAERARLELADAGERVRKRQGDPLDLLSPQEQLIARMARDGRTNPEIGADLYLSGRTVEWHLRKVFSKLGISSRKGLRDALAGVEGDGPPV